MTTMIKESVGQHGRNKPVDVAMMQALMTHYCTTLGPNVKGRSCSVIAPNIVPPQSEMDFQAA